MGDTGNQEGATAVGPTVTPKKRKPRSRNKNKNNASKNSQEVKKPNENITTEGTTPSSDHQVATPSSTPTRAHRPKDEGNQTGANKQISTPQPHQSLPQQPKPQQPKFGGPKPQQNKKNPTTPKRTNVAK